MDFYHSVPLVYVDDGAVNGIDHQVCQGHVLQLPRRWRAVFPALEGNLLIARKQPIRGLCGTGRVDSEYGRA